MASQVQKAKCELWCHESKFVITVQRRFFIVFGRESSEKCHLQVVQLFSEAGCACKAKSPLELPVAEAEVNEAPASFVCCPSKSTI
jgi:hypothetical protein